MPTFEEPQFIICNRVSDNLPPVAGSTITNCCMCDAALWISPTGGPIMGQTEARPICLRCVEAKAKAGEPVEFAPMSDAQKAELRAELRRRAGNPRLD